MLKFLNTTYSFDNNFALKFVYLPQFCKAREETATAGAQQSALTIE